MKVVQLHEWTPKQFLIQMGPKNSPLGPQKVKNNPKIKSNLDVRIQEIIQNESFSST